MEKFKEFLGKTKEFLTKNWKVILICIAVLLLMGQCASCNRDNRADKLQNEKTTSEQVSNKTIDSLNTVISHLENRISDLQSLNKNYEEFATGTKNEVIAMYEAKIKELEAKIKSNEAKIKELEASNKAKDALIEAYKQDNIRLNKEVVDLMEKLNNIK